MANELLRNYPLGRGVLASIVGTIAFGLMMTMMGMMPMVAALVGASSVLVGWVVHLAIGAAFGVVFPLVARALPTSAWLSGLAYGAAIWVVGPLVIMPLWLGMPEMVFALGAPTPWWSLLGHLIYGVLTGLTFGKLASDSASAPRSGHPNP